MAQLVKNLPAMQETQVQSLGREDPLVKEMAMHSNTLAWRIPWTVEPGRLQSMGLQRVRHDCATNIHFHFFTEKFRTHYTANELYAYIITFSLSGKPELRQTLESLR